MSALRLFNVALIAFLFSSTMCVIASVGTGQFQIKKEYTNKCLVGHVILEISVNNIHDCARECFLLALCKSMNYYRGRCTMNDADSQSATSSDFVSKAGAIFSDIEDWPNVSR